MRKFGKWTVAVIVALLCVMMVGVASASTVASGKCGDNVRWTVDSNGTLTISGTGAMASGTFNLSLWGEMWIYYPDVRHVVIEEGVTTIGAFAFFDWGDLKSVSIPSTVTKIGEEAFGGTGLTSVNIPNGVTCIENFAFGGCDRLTEVKISSSVTSIGDYAFSACASLKSISIPDSVTSFGECVFAFCDSLTDVKLPAGLTSIPYYTFSYCASLKSISFPSGVTSIEEGAFNACALTSVVIPSGVTSIGAEAFARCSNLSSVTIPSSVTSIGEQVFDKCAQDLVIYGESGSTAETYAKENDIPFVAINSTPAKIAAPKLSSVTNTATGITIKWGKVTGAAKYRVYYKTTGSWKKLTDTTATSYTWTKAKSGTKYTFTVCCMDKAGKTKTSDYNKTGKSITYLAAPKLSSVTNAATGITIKWGKVTGAAKYRIYYKTTGGWKKLVDTAKTSYTWTKAKSGTKYTFTVRSLSSTGKTTSAYDTTGKSITYVAAPKLSSVKASGTSVTIKWGKVTGATKYRVYYKTTGGWKKLTETTKTSYTWKKAKSGVKYTFTVCCIDSKGNATSAYDTKGKAVTIK